MTIQDSIAKLTADVAASTSAEQSAITLLQGLTAEIKTLAANQTDPAVQASLDSLAATIETNTAGLAAAVTANTPPPTTPPAA